MSIDSMLELSIAGKRNPVLKKQTKNERSRVDSLTPIGLTTVDLDSVPLSYFPTDISFPVFIQHPMTQGPACSMVSPTSSVSPCPGPDFSATVDS